MNGIRELAAGGNMIISIRDENGLAQGIILRKKLNSFPISLKKI